MFSALPRRDFLVSSLSGAAAFLAPEVPSALGQDAFLGCIGKAPLACIRTQLLGALRALVEAQLHSLWGAQVDGNTEGITEQTLRFIEHLDPPLHRGLCLALRAVDLYSVRLTGLPLAQLTPTRRMTLLNQGEAGAAPSDEPARGQRFLTRLPLILWKDHYILHTATSGLTMITRLVITAQPSARKLVGMTWSQPCQAPENLAKVSAPSYPDLTQEFDVCIVGSGAGGSVVAARAAEEGRRVLIVEEGAWISPDELVERVPDGVQGIKVMPARGDTVLMRLYRGAGVQIVGEMPGLAQNAGKIGPNPPQTIGILQARVVGGGPYINNAIHLEIEKDVWEKWRSRTPARLDYRQFWSRMQQVKRDLGVNTVATQRGAGDRSLRFAEGCRRAGIAVEPLPVSILPKNAGCGSDNSVDAFGYHIGGLHPYRKNVPNSYLMRALHASPAAQVAHQMRAVRFEFSSSSDAPLAVKHLVVEDLRKAGSGSTIAIRAKQFVLAAGAIESTRLLATSLNASNLAIEGLGERFSGNVVTAIYAEYDKPIVRPDSPRPEPGITQCFYVRAKKGVRGGGTVLEEPALENWFHYPDTMAAALPGWFQQYASVVKKYNHLALAGMIAPTKVRQENRIDRDGTVHLTLDNDEFELLLKGIEKAGRIFLAAADKDNGVTLHLPTRAVLLDNAHKPCVVRGLTQLESAIKEIRRRGPSFLLLATAHPQGGNPLGSLVDPDTFHVRLSDGRQVNNLLVADASIFPAGCEVNPQLTIHTLAMYAADSLLECRAGNRGRRAADPVAG